MRERLPARSAPPRSRSAVPRRLAIAALLAALPSLCGCATLVSFPFSPLTGSFGSIAHNESSGWDVLWGYPLGFVAGALWGPVMALSIGISADVGYVSTGGYGESDYPRFFDAFDPYGYSLAKPEPMAETPK